MFLGLPVVEFWINKGVLGWFRGDIYIYNIYIQREHPAWGQLCHVTLGGEAAGWERWGDVIV